MPTLTVTIPVTRPLSCEWAELRTRLATVWDESTSLANWALLQLIAAEPAIVPGEPFSKFPDVYLYGRFKKYEHRDFWHGAAASANSIFRAVMKRWKEDRRAVLWQRCQAPPTFRYPYPYRLHNATWKAAIVDNVVNVTVALPGGRVTLLLRSGAEYRRQLAQVREIVSGKAKQGEMLITKDRKTGQVMIRMIADFKPLPETERTGTMLVRSDPNAFLVAEIEDTHPRVWNQDHMKGVVLTHKVWLQRVSEDTKFEKRVPRTMRRHIDQVRDVRCRKYNNRIDSFCHEMSAQVAELARRQRTGTVILDTDCDSFIPTFPWHNFKTKLAYKLKSLGIALIGKTPCAKETTNGAKKKSGKPKACKG